MSEIVEDILFGEPESEPKLPEMEQKRKPKEQVEPEQPDFLGQISKAIENLINPINQRLDEIEKRIAQPVQFRTSEPQTGSSSAARPEAAKRTGQDGQ